MSRYENSDWQVGMPLPSRKDKHGRKKEKQQKQKETPPPLEEIIEQPAESRAEHREKQPVVQRVEKRVELHSKQLAESRAEHREEQPVVQRTEKRVEQQLKQPAESRVAYREEQPVVQRTEKRVEQQMKQPAESRADDREDQPVAQRSEKRVEQHTKQPAESLVGHRDQQSIEKPAEPHVEPHAEQPVDHDQAARLAAEPPVQTRAASLREQQTAHNEMAAAMVAELAGSERTAEEADEKELDDEEMEPMVGKWTYRLLLIFVPLIVIAVLIYGKIGYVHDVPPLVRENVEAYEQGEGFLVLKPWWFGPPVYKLDEYVSGPSTTFHQFQLNLRDFAGIVEKPIVLWQFEQDFLDK